MKKHPSAEPTQRQLRVGEQIRHIVAETMQRGHFSDEALQDAGIITVSEVRVSPDLKNATIYVMPLGGKNIENILPALNDQAQVFQKDINNHSNLKFTPRVKFMCDHSFENAENIENILREIDLPQDDS